MAQDRLTLAALLAHTASTTVYLPTDLRARRKAIAVEALALADALIEEERAARAAMDAAERETLMLRPVEDLEFSVRALNLLRDNGVLTIGAFMDLDVEQVRRHWRGAGQRTALEMLEMQRYLRGERR